MMILRSSPASPFGRKVRIAASVLGLADKIEVRETNPNDPADSSIRVQNPVGKIPVLILEDGTTYYDSRVIVEYLDYLAGGGRIIPREPGARFAALRLQALCDGILDACHAAGLRESLPARRQASAELGSIARPTKSRARSEAWKPRRRNSIPFPTSDRSRSPACSAISDLRFGGTWRKDYPKLLAWHDKFAAQVPAFGETKIEP